MKEQQMDALRIDFKHSTITQEYGPHKEVSRYKDIRKNVVYKGMFIRDASTILMEEIKSFLEENKERNNG